MCFLVISLNIFIPMAISIAKKSLSLYIYNMENAE